MANLGDIPANADLVAGAYAWQVGTLLWFVGASTAIPSGWLECNGQSTTGHAALAALVGSTVPDLRGNTLAGADTVVTLLGTHGTLSHSHGATSLSGGQHTHDAGSYFVDPSHTHGHNYSLSSHAHNTGTSQVLMNGSGGAFVGVLQSTATGNTQPSVTGGISTATSTPGVSGTSSSSTPGFNGTTATATAPHVVGLWIVKF